MADQPSSEPQHDQVESIAAVLRGTFTTHQLYSLIPGWLGRPRDPHAKLAMHLYMSGIRFKQGSQVIAGPPLASNQAVSYSPPK